MAHKDNLFVDNKESMFADLGVNHSERLRAAGYIVSCK